MNDTGTAAFEHNGAAIDRRGFYDIACDPRRSVVVEACAGAGKTWMLVSRIVRALLDGCAPQDILAITFTKKAAAEMRARLQQWLQEFASASDEQLARELRDRGLVAMPDTHAGACQIAALRGLHGTLLQSGRSVQIRTFHSWFAALVRNAPLAALHAMGLPVSYELLEDDTQAVNQVWRRFQARLVQDPAGKADYLAAVAAYGRHNAQKALEAALAKRTEFSLADARGVVQTSVREFGAQFPDFAGLDDPLDFLLTAQALAQLQAAASALGGQAQKKRRDAASGLEQGITQRDPVRIAEALLTQKGEPRKLGDFDGSQHVALAQDMLLRVKAASNQHSAWQHQQRMARLTRGLISDYQDLKRERGWLDMGDLEQAALALMSDPVLSGWVQQRLDVQVRHLLIDEFQDTNPLQWQALHAWLAAYVGDANAPSVFIVGDPKQSIYRFRRAEPQVFVAAKDFVRCGLQGELLSCDHTRRNANAIVQQINGVMLQAQAAGQFDGFRAHTTESKLQGELVRLAPVGRDVHPPEVAGPTAGVPQWRDSLTTARFEEEESRKALECRQAADWIKRALQSRKFADGRAWQAGDIMVLARKRERLALMQTELANLRIPVQQPEKNDLADMPEVQDMVALLDVLVSEQHDIALARVLKSPLFRLDDAALVQLVQCQRTLQAQAPEQGTVSWMQTLRRATGLPAALAGLGATLSRWQQWAGSLPPHDALSAIYRDGDVLARYAAASPPEARNRTMDNLNALLHAALAVDGGRYTTAYTLVRAVRAGGIKAPVQADTAAVRLLTVHGAKGLEAPVVVLLDTDGEAQKGESMGVLVEWPGQSLHPTRFVFLVSESRPSACAVDALTTERLARSREELNGLYVAMTRAIHTLVVSSMEPRNANPDSWWRRMHALLPAAETVGCTSAVQVASPSPEGVAATPLAIKVLPLRVKTGTATSDYDNQGGDAGQPVQHEQEEQDSLESRIGQAMHRLLEWLPSVPGGHGGPNGLDFDRWWTAQRRTQAAQEFLLDPDPLTLACGMAQAIACGQGAWCWDSDQVQWQANEVPVNRGGRVLRIDRLVQDRSGQWWVLDYKSAAQPQLQPDLCAQLEDYRATVRVVYPDATVRAAFLTSRGALIEMAAP